jgi:SAM-dependent methyltransferase
MMARSGGAGWDDGYVTDVGYTSNVYRETTPCWLALTALLLGQRPPDLARPFRYADLGCGNGMTALFVAATCPQAEVWGFDFNPAHIETARRWASAAGLGNVHFVETSFAELAALPVAGLPEFDFIVSHGVLSWISPRNQEAMIAVIGQRLRAGGLAYMGYNTTTGWGAMLPVHTLMRLMAETRPERTDLAVPAIFDQLQRLKDSGARYFPANPAADSRIETVRKQDRSYVAHELLNADWHPMMAAQVMDTMATVKCQFVGSATLTENIDAVSQAPEMQKLIAETADPRLRETLRDFGVAQGFRRDVYRRGLVPLPAAEQVEMLDALRFARCAALPTGDVSFTTAIGTFTGRAEVYQPLLALLENGSVSLAEARQTPAFAGRPTGELVQALTLLASGGFVHPVLPDPEVGRASARALNRAIARANANGVDLPRLAAPAIGSMVAIDTLETLVVGRLLDGAAADETALAGYVLEMLRRTGRNLQREGKVVDDPAESLRLAGELVGKVLGPRARLLRGLGVLEG